MNSIRPRFLKERKLLNTLQIMWLYLSIKRLRRRKKLILKILKNLLIISIISISSVLTLLKLKMKVQQFPTLRKWKNKEKMLPLRAQLEPNWSLPLRIPSRPPSLIQEKMKSISTSQRKKRRRRLLKTSRIGEWP